MKDHHENDTNPFLTVAEMKRSRKADRIKRRLKKEVMVQPFTLITIKPGYIHTIVHTYIHTIVHTYIHIHKRIHTYIHTYIHIYNIHIYIHTCTHTYKQTKIHTYIHKN